MDSDLKLKAGFSGGPPTDPRFPNTNQAGNCWASYNKFAHCMNLAEGDESKCKTLYGFAKNVCPQDWIEEWDGQRDEGKFAGVAKKYE